MGLTPGNFDYIRVSSFREAAKTLSEEENSKILAGGQSLIPLLKTRIMSVDLLIDISGIKGAGGIRQEKNSLEIGATYRVGELEANSLVAESFPILHDAASSIADPLVRNMGTVGGNLAHADPGNDLPPVMVAMDAGFTVLGSKGERVERASTFFKGAFSTQMDHSDTLASVRINRGDGNVSSAFVKQRKSAGDFSLASVAAMVELDDSGSFKNSRTVLGSVFSAPMILEGVDAFLKGKRANSETIKGAASLVKSQINPGSDFFASADYRKHVSSLLVNNALTTAVRRAGVDIA